MPCGVARIVLEADDTDAGSTASPQPKSPGAEPLGFPPERRDWKAHVTLARVKGHRDLDRVRQVLTSRHDDRFASHRVDRIYLKKSVLTPQGALYSVLETVSLVR